MWPLGLSLMIDCMTPKIENVALRIENVALRIENVAHRIENVVIVWLLGVRV